MSVRASHLLVKHAVATHTPLSTHSTTQPAALLPFLPCVMRGRASSAHAARVVLVRQSTGRIVGADSVPARSPASSPARRARGIVSGLLVACHEYLAGIADWSIPDYLAGILIPDDLAGVPPPCELEGRGRSHHRQAHQGTGV